MNIAVVGKYTALNDAYKSLIEALIHGGVANNVRVNLDWIEGEAFEGDEALIGERLTGVHGVLVPGGFGERGSEGKIRAVQFAREHAIPYFGICFGMQMAMIEAARNLAGIKQRLLHRVRPDLGADRRPDDRVGAAATSRRLARRGRRPRRHHALRRLRRGADAGLARSRRSTASTDHLRAPPPPLRGQHRLPRGHRGRGPEVHRPVARRRAARARASATTIPGSSACSSTRS